MENYNQVKRKERELFVFNMIFYREENKLTQSEFAEKIGHGLKQRTYAAWEEGRAFPSISFCRIIAELMGTNIETMLTKKFSLKTE